MEEEAHEVARHVAPAALGQLVGWLTGDPTGAVGAGFGALLSLASQRFETGVRRIDVMWQAVADLTPGLKPADVENWATGREERVDLIVFVLQAAADARCERKVRALARVLAQAVSGDVRLDHGRLIVTALAELDEPHIQVLTVMATEAPPPTNDLMGPGYWSRRQLQDRLPGHGRSVAPLTAGLVRAGVLIEATLAADDDEEGLNSAWTVLPFGRECHQYLDDLRMASAN